MSSYIGRTVGRGAFFLALVITGSALAEPPPQASKSRVEAALENIMTLDRPGQNGYATIWDGNKYVQCSRLADRSLRCEAAGTLMQPSLDHVLTPEHVSKLATLGWHLDPSFGNYVQSFPTGAAAGSVADKILQVLGEAYEADLANLEVETAWLPSEPCPPRNGPTQNLAGMINNAPSMRATAVHACTYNPKPEIKPSQPVASAAELFNFYGTRVTGEIARLRVNMHRYVFAVFGASIGYVQCKPDASPPAIYCEAQSADSWEALASVLSSERLARLHAAGFGDPGRKQNYWKTYLADQFDDAAIAREVLTILHDVYGYTGTPELKITTEEARH